MAIRVTLVRRPAVVVPTAVLSQFRGTLIERATKERTLEKIYSWEDRVKRYTLRHASERPEGELIRLRKVNRTVTL